ncbi:MAG: rhodanese-like domain-containing protein [Bacillota bacterium]
MKRNLLIILAAILIIALFSGILWQDKLINAYNDIFTSEEIFEEAEYKSLSPEEAKEMMENEDVIVVDVRTEEEFRQGHIEGAILIPDYDLDTLASEKLPDREATILLYCRSGNRSKLSAHLLNGMGYQNVYDFGGILDWRYGEIQGEPAN